MRKLGMTALSVGLGIGAIGLLLSVEKVPTGYVGVQYSMNGGVSDELLTQGWHLVSPTKKVSLYSIATEQLYMSKDKKDGSKEDESFSIMCKDGQLNVDFEMSYSFNSDDVVELYEKYRGLDGQSVVDTKIRGKIKTYINEVTTNFTVLEAHMEKKGELNSKLTEHLRKSLEPFGVYVESATLSRTEPSESVKQAIENRTKIAQELEAEKQKQEKAKLEAETLLIKVQAEQDKENIQNTERNKRMLENAQTEAEAILKKAEAQAKANQKLAQSLTEQVIKHEYIEAWKSGGAKVPQVQSDESMPIINVGK